MAFIHTKPWALYNEIDEYAAAWLENLIAMRVIANGIVDRRSVEDLRPDELRGFRQVHLFAGIGVWSYSLRRIGVPDDLALWTLSCPCQPFSAAGKGGGMDDERHLWPAAYHLARECRPPRFFGEQVASSDGLHWVDLVQTDVEAADYAIGPVDTCSAGSGAPHIRQRLRFAAYDIRSTSARMDDTFSDGWRSRRRDNRENDRFISDTASSVSGMDHHHHTGLEGLRGGHSTKTGQRERSVRSTSQASEFGRMADSTFIGWVLGSGFRSCEQGERRWHVPSDDVATVRLADDHHFEQRQRGESGGQDCEGLRPELGGCGHDFRLANTDILNDDGAGSFSGIERGQFEKSSGLFGLTASDGLANADNGQLQDDGRRKIGRDGSSASGRLGEGFAGRIERACPTNGFWRDADWLYCRDGKWRPTEPESFPLVDGTAFRLGSGSPFEGKSRQGMLKGYGNAVDAEATADFLEACFEWETEPARDTADLDFEPLI